MNRFEIFKEVCKLMDESKYFEAYLKLGELQDFLLQESLKNENVLEKITNLWDNAG